MTGGIRATVVFDPDVCPVSRTIASAGVGVDQITTSVASDGSHPVAEFRVDADHDPDVFDLDPVFEHEENLVYRTAHAGGECPCELLGRIGCPVDRFLADEQHLTIVFYAAGYDALRSSIDEILSTFPEADVRRLVRSTTGDGPADTDTVLIDRGQLTDRQLEAIRAAYRMGYFDRPRGATAGEVAEELGIGPSTLTEHLATAQQKLFRDFFGKTTE